MLIILRSAIVSVLLIVAIAAPLAAAQRIRGRVIEIRAPDTIVVALESTPEMPAMSMPFVVAPRTLSMLHRGALITAVVDARTSPASLAAIRVVTAPSLQARYVPELHEGDTVPDFALVDQLGRRLSLSHFRGQALVLTFIYTRCQDPTMCSLVSAKFSGLQRALGREPIHLMEVTLDPAYDTPAVLERYGGAFGASAARWTLATGDASTVSDLAARAGIVTTSTPHGIVHTEAVVILDPTGRLFKVVDGNRWAAEDVLSEARASFGKTPNSISRLLLWLESGVAAACGGGSGVSIATALSIFVVVLVATTLLLRRFLRAGTTRT